jgi:hypothetical protein
LLLVLVLELVLLAGLFSRNPRLMEEQELLVDKHPAGTINVE